LVKAHISGKKKPRSAGLWFLDFQFDRTKRYSPLWLPIKIKAAKIKMALAESCFHLQCICECPANLELYFLPRNP
jgi:hypothetical protein